MWKRPQDAERIGNYAFLNHVPGPTGGTFRQVWQRGVLPDPGAQVFGYSTFLVPNIDPFPYGGRCALPPDPRSGGAGFNPQLSAYTPSLPSPVPPGFLERFGLAAAVASAKPTGG